MTEPVIPSEWYFILPPKKVDWSKASRSKTINTYGSNAPYLNYGTTGLRELKLGEAMVEGFSDGKQVEGNILNLEACMQMVIEEGTGYAAPYCWKLYAGDKSYGTFIIKSVDVNEKMRDLSGKATRAFVDIQLQEVSPLQVNAGIDITSTAITGSLSQEGELALQTLEQSEANGQDAAVAGARGRGGAGRGNAGTAGSAAPGAPGNASTSVPGSSTPGGPPRPDYETRYNTERGLL